MKFSRWFFPLILLLIIHPVIAQEEGEEESSPFPVYRYPAAFIKFSPLALMELPNPSFQVALEYRIGWPMYLQHELGWIMPVPGNSFFNEGNGSGGGKFKTEFRYYLEDAQSDIFLPRRTYLAFEGMYRVRIFHREGWETMNDGSFSQWLEMDEYRHQAAFHFKYGKIMSFSPGGRLYVDSYLGIGLRRYFSTARQLTGALAGEPNLDRWSYDYVLPSISVGFKLGFGI
ncbi:MAG: hypothetical protein R6V49_02520 [Bacteroidales bacterium]